jgi:hypothetical protein
MPENAPSPHVPYVGWVPYEGRAAVVLAIALIALAAASTYIGTRLRTPISVSRPGRTVSCFMIAIWALAIPTFLVAAGAYGMQLRQMHVPFATARARVGTFLDAIVTFFVILYLTRRYGWRVAVGSAVIGTAAAPMIFELPFDLIVMPMTYPPVPPTPTLYRALFFLPLFIIEFSTISLLTLLPSMRITNRALYALAAMFAVFAVWAAFGFGFPAEPLPKTLNIISKILCFVTAIMLFVWPDAQRDGVA